VESVRSRQRFIERQRLAPRSVATRVHLFRTNVRSIVRPRDRRDVGRTETSAIPIAGVRRPFDAYTENADPEGEREHALEGWVELKQLGHSFVGPDWMHRRSAFALAVPRPWD
jgi:hypothetical protein